MPYTIRTDLQHIDDAIRVLVTTLANESNVTKQELLRAAIARMEAYRECYFDVHGSDETSSYGTYATTLANGILGEIYP